MSAQRVMLFIDADNVSADIIEQAVGLLLAQHGALHVRRAYCTAESALKQQSLFRRLAIKPMVNLSTGKNSTDIALAVDAVHLVVSDRPDVVVIASSDSDFAPLVLRLRERGCIVRGIGQLGKTGDETQEIYDDFTVLEHRKSAGTTGRSSAGSKVSARTARTARTATATTAPAAPAPVSTAAAAAPAAKPAKPASRRRATKAALSEPAPLTDVDIEIDSAPPPAPEPAPRAASRRTPARKSAKPSPVPPPVAKAAPQPSGRAGGASVRAILDCLPELADGQALALNVAVQRLREGQLLGKHASSLKLFAQWADHFELSPSSKPTRVRLRN